MPLLRVKWALKRRVCLAWPNTTTTMNYTIHVVSKSQFILIAISQNVDIALLSQQKESIKFDIATYLPKKSNPSQSHISSYANWLNSINNPIEFNLQKILTIRSSLHLPACHWLCCNRRMRDFKKIKLMASSSESVQDPPPKKKNWRQRPYISYSCFSLCSR